MIAKTMIEKNYDEKLERRIWVRAEGWTMTLKTFTFFSKRKPIKNVF